jgi:PleD family two-component response regulator
LGLVIARHLIAAHHGKLRTLNPDANGNLGYEIVLPAAARKGQDAASSARQPAASPGKGTGSASFTLDRIRVLVVDDNPDACELLRRMLAHHGAIVALAASVEEVLATIHTIRPDVLISDIRLSGKDGYELIRQIRARSDQLRELPAIALTAFAR